MFTLIFFFSLPSLYAQEVRFVTSFGNEIDPELFEFAAIRDIAVHDNHIFVLDDILNQIHHLKFENDEVVRVGEIPI